MNIPYIANGFSPSSAANLLGNNTLTLNWPDIVRAGITVGRPSWWHVGQFGTQSIHEALYRRHLIFANLIESAANLIGKSESYEWLDPSEKGAVSYFLGLAITNAFSEYLLGIPWLLHINVYRHLLPRVNRRGNRRPDLVGTSAGQHWYVFECKGRTHGPERGLLRNAKQQARSISSIGGIPPSACIASVIHFRPGHLTVIWEDPKPKDEASFKLELSASKLINDYYAPISTFLNDARSDQSRREFDGIEFTVAPIPGTNDHFGLATSIFAASDKASSALDQLRGKESTSTEFISVGLDGTYLELGPDWRRASMLLQPEDRTF